MGLKSTMLFLACLSATPSIRAAAPGLIPAREWKMIREVAVNYDLTEEQTWLLAAIRRHENGRPGLEFGIGGPMNSGHAAHRYQDGTKSFYIQAMWAAGTIRKHYRGDLKAFGRRYNPPHPTTWSDGVSSLIRRLKAENGHTLPGVRPAKRVISFP
ncbi:MAG: hypothetical protein ACI4R9_06175 [Kiritimatiellia bacterium]